MKSGSAESPKQLQTVPESAAIYDFLYVDRARVSTLYAQLFPQGVLTSVKTHAQQSFADDQNFGTDIKVFKAETKVLEAGAEGIEHVFDPAWAVPVEVLDRLKTCGLVRESLIGAGLGSAVLAECLLRVIDFESMDNLWAPAMKIAFGSDQQGQQIIPEVVPTLTEALKAMPQAVHAHFLTKEAFLWSSLLPSGLTIPRSDLTLKYGGTVSGSWKVLYILDSWPDSGEAPNTEGWSGGEMMNGILTAMHGLRTLAGRPPSWAGATPLMIFRSMSGWLPQSGADTRPRGA